MSNNPWVNGVGSPAGTYFAGGTDVAVTDGGTGSSSAVAAAQALSVPYVLAQWCVPVMAASSGSMGNNGAVTAMTALDRTISGAWVFFPASAISAGSAAGFYWFVGSSTTAGTVFNSTWDGLSVPTAGTATAFSTTGPGAFTGVTTEQVAVTITIPALAANSSLEIDSLWNVTNNANAKTPRIRIGAAGAGTGGTAMFGPSPASIQAFAAKSVIRNNNSTSAQIGLTSTGLLGVSTGGSGMTTAAINLAAGTAQMVLSLQKGTATDYLVLEGGTVVVRF